MSIPELPALPNELLLMLADNLEPCDLNALLRASRHMHALFNTALYKASVKNRGNHTLYWACMKGVPAVASRCLALGAPADTACSHHTMVFQGANSETPLFCAINHNKPEVVKVLLDHGVNIDSQSRAGFTPLDVATRSGKDEIIRLLLDKGANINQSSPRSDSPLHYAVIFKREQHLGTIRILLEKGADVNATNGDQSTPLHLAQDKEAAEILVAWRADVNVVNRYDQTPLSYAIKEKDATWVKLLLRAGAHVNEPNRKGETPLFFIGQPGKERKNTDAEIAAVLLEAGAKIGHNDINGSTALHAMCYDGDEETIKLLLSKGSDACARNRKGLTPLHIAAEEGHPAILRLLLNQGANVNATNYYRSSPLHRMASIPKRKLRAPGNQERFVEAMKVLLDAGADLNKQDRIGQTPLMKASYHGYWRFVAVMMEREECDLTIKDRRGKTAAGLAKESGGESRELARATEAAVLAKKLPGGGSSISAQKAPVMDPMVGGDDEMREGIREAVEMSLEVRGVDEFELINWEGVIGDMDGDTGNLWGVGE